MTRIASTARRRSPMAAAAAAACALAPAAGLTEPAAAQAVATQPAVTSLSVAGVSSRWAYLERRTKVYARPARGARVLGRLGLSTQDGTDELLYAEARTRRRGAHWVRVRLPLRPTGAVGWVLESALGAMQTIHTHLVVDRRRLTATLRRSGKVILRARVGIGAPATPTPAGEFYVRTRLRGFAGNPVYGPLAFGTSARSRALTDWPGGGFIGIHGTNVPGLIPGRPSHGCVRMRNADILRLERLMPVGTPITVR